MKQSGFTLIELLSTVILIIIVTTMAAPSFSALVKTAKSDKLKSDWLTFLNYGRSSAIMSQKNIIACPIINDQCSNDLSQAWLLFEDINENKKLDSDETKLREFGNLERATFSIYPSNQPYFRFNYHSGNLLSGYARGFTVCPDGEPSSTAFHIKVNITGRLRFEYEENEQGQLVHKRNGSWQAFDC